MVKTRQQQAKQQAQSSIKNECGVQTRAGARKLERVELPAIVLSKELNKRHQIKKEIVERFGDIVGDQDDISFEEFSEKEIKIKELFNGEFY